MSAIRRLEQSVASRIAAGEVIERPFSAAKEMIENCIDAGAKNISVALEDGGKAMMIVEDDGAGIDFDDMPLALERYATSKIATLDDLERVRTLGYRGEALSSIAAVSRLEVRSRRTGCDGGGMIVCEGGEIKAHARIPASPGTRVQICDLFYNMPARRRFLKSAPAETRRVSQIVSDYALARPDIRFRMTSDGRGLLDLGGGMTTDEVLASLWGTESRVVRASLDRTALSADIWWNDMPGSRRVSVTLFVNGRRVQDATVRSALSATGSSIYGEWLVMISLPPEEVDVNIHPTKAEIRFRKSGPIFEIVRSCAEKVLLAGGGFVAAGVPASAPLLEAVRDHQAAHETDLFTVPQRASQKSSDDKELITSAEAHRGRKYLGQAQGGYLVFDDSRGLCLVDAHAAHERILYEQIEDTFRSRAIGTQRLVEPQEMPPALVPQIELHRESLASMGFTFSPHGDGAPRLLSVPVLRGLGHLSSTEMLRSAIAGLEDEPDPSKRDREVWWRWARTACRDAIKLGAVLTELEAQDLFDRLERCRSPYSCPHGRPTTIFLAREKLKSWFDR